MRYTVPQFIEREAKILGPMTFKQVLYIGGAVIIIAVLYFIAPSLIFTVAAFLLIVASLFLAFFKFSGRPLPNVLVSVLSFSFDPKIYIWKKEIEPIIVYQKEKKPVLIKKEKEELPLKIAEKSRLKKLHSEIETRTK